MVLEGENLKEIPRELPTKHVYFHYRMKIFEPFLLGQNDAVDITEGRHDFDRVFKVISVPENCEKKSNVVQ